VTKGRADASATKAYEPDGALVQQYASAYSLDKEKLAAAVSQFGPLLEAGQEQLIRCLVLAFGRYQFAAKTIKHVTPGQQHEQLKEIETTARKLLCLLGINMNSGTREHLFATAWLEQAGINIAGMDAHIVNAELSKAHAEVANSVTALLSLYRRAKVAADAATTRMKRGRGGTHHHPTPEGQLTRDAIAIYKHVKARFPEGGNKPGMRPFVRSVGALVGVRITDGAIKEAERAWGESKTN
jgi:hypothetical protein